MTDAGVTDPANTPEKDTVIRMNTWTIIVLHMREVNFVLLLR